MKLLLRTVPLLTLCSLSACAEPERIAVAVKPPPEKLVCEGAPARPAIPADNQLERDRIVAGYLLDVEGRLFTCASNAAWLRDWYAGMPDGG